MADVSDEDAVNAMVAKIKAEVGPVDILVNNAGLMKRVPDVYKRQTLHRTPTEYRAQLSPDRVMRVDSRKFLPSEDPILQAKLRAYLKVGC